MNGTKRIQTPGTSQQINVDFNILDAKGRRIGAGITTWEVDHIDSLHGAYDVEPGHYYCFEPWATRDGNPYGAVQPYREFKTVEERGKAIDKYLAGARKRAQRNFPV